MTTRLSLSGCALLVLALLGAGACSRAHPHAAAAASPTVASADQILAIGRRYSQCIRAHGVPTFPDPVINGGYLTLPDGPNGDNGKLALSKNPAAQRACQSIIDELPPSATRPRKPKTLDMQTLMRFAQCMRQHGMPNWPDPDSNGDFPLHAAGIEAKSTASQAAMQACRQNGSGPIGVK
jgi:hypothetical protein